MLVFFTIFVITGAIIGITIEDKKVGLTVIVIASMIWAFVFGSWAIATFVELLLGFYLVKKIKRTN